MRAAIKKAIEAEIADRAAMAELGIIGEGRTLDQLTAEEWEWYGPIAHRAGALAQKLTDEDYAELIDELDRRTEEPEEGRPSFWQSVANDTQATIAEIRETHPDFMAHRDVMRRAMHARKG